MDCSNLSYARSGETMTESMDCSNLSNGRREDTINESMDSINLSNGRSGEESVDNTTILNNRREETVTESMDRSKLSYGRSGKTISVSMGSSNLSCDWKGEAVTESVDYTTLLYCSGETVTESMDSANSSYVRSEKTLTESMDSINLSYGRSGEESVDKTIILYYRSRETITESMDSSKLSYGRSGKTITISMGSSDLSCASNGEAVTESVDYTTLLHCSGETVTESMDSTNSSYVRSEKTLTESMDSTNLSYGRSGEESVDNTIILYYRSRETVTESIDSSKLSYGRSGKTMLESMGSSNLSCASTGEAVTESVDYTTLLYCSGEMVTKSMDSENLSYVRSEKTLTESMDSTNLSYGNGEESVDNTTILYYRSGETVTESLDSKNISYCSGGKTMTESMDIANISNKGLEMTMVESMDNASFINGMIEETVIECMEEDSLLTDINGETTEPAAVRNDLERYLDDVLEHEVKFKIDNMVTNFIQSQVEQVVDGIISYILTCESDAIKTETQKLIETFPYLRPRSEQRSERMLKVGSYYEGTKIGFPDEFDFVFIVDEFETEKLVSSEMRYHQGNSAIHTTIIKILTAQWKLMPKEHRPTIFKMNYEHGPFGAQSIGLDGFYPDQRGPSTKLIFKYMNTSGLERNIYVDLVPAFKVHVYEKPTSVFVPANKKRNCPKEFQKEIEETGSILIVNGLISFTETEVRFMKFVLSPKHRLVYKILKYLINGHDCSELVRDKLIQFGLWRYNFGLISSYMIKTEMIFHHYQCTNHENKSVADCVLDLLETIKNIESNKSLRMLSDYYRRPTFYNNRVRYNSLRDMIQEFEVMKTCFTGKRASFTPINKIYLEQRNNEIQPERPTRDNTGPTEYIKCCCIAFRYLVLITVICIFVIIVVSFVFH